MGYVRTAGMSTAARRARRRGVLVILTLLLGLLIALLVAVGYMRGWIGSDDGAADDAQVTATAEPPALTAADVSANVYNSTDRVGLAGRTAAALRERGFHVDSVADDPERANVESAGVIRHGPEGLREATFLAEQLGQGIELLNDGRTTAKVDLVLGATFEELPAVTDDEPDDADDSDADAHGSTESSKDHD